MAFNALSGFSRSMAAIFARECHTPERNIARSVWIAAPGIALLYILGTCGMLAYVSRDRIDLIAPVSQILGAALHSSALAAYARQRALFWRCFLLHFTQAGKRRAWLRCRVCRWWPDGMASCPRGSAPCIRDFVRRFGRSRWWWRSALKLSAVQFNLFQVGDGRRQPRYLIAAATACCGLYYLAAMSRTVVIRGNAPLWLARSGLRRDAVTTLAVAFDAVVPILDVALGPAVFGAKVAGAVVAINLAGAWAYRRCSAAKSDVALSAQ